MTETTGPLAGIRVIDLTINVLGPMATQLMGDMGADVVKVEPPAGDPMREMGPRRSPGMATHFVSFNRSKRSVVLDLKQPDQLEKLMALVDGADVFVHNMRAAAAARLGIGPDAVRARNPAIVYAYATGYAKDGPKRDRPAFDDVIQGESGIAGLIGQANGEPRYMPYAMADKLCGVYLAMAVNAALVHRERSGEGQVVHLPMLETMVSFNLADHMWEMAFSGEPADAGFPRMFSPNRRPYPTKDGYISLLAVTDAQFRRLFRVLARDDLADDPRFATMVGRNQNVRELGGIVAAAISERSTAEWQRRLDQADIPNAPMNTLTDLFADPYLWAQGLLRRYEHPSDGTYTEIGFPIDFASTPAGATRPPARLGEHDDEVFGKAD
ncbi:MAG: CoA transferase [Alphaproteobacteria bacterium]